MGMGRGLQGGGKGMGWEGGSGMGMDSLGGRLEAQKLLEVELSSTWKSCRERELMGVNWG